ncbi:ABC transporter substrate-binding protein [Euzebya sp.]|uniref:ABC transporter substrate-binding protein n=1 Tax=Euzebya sp. TaxID=1971409 RepID=UPI003519A185
MPAPHRPSTPRPSSAWTLLVGVLALLAACGGDGGASDPATDGAGAATGPVSIENCGEQVEFASPPGRVVVLARAETFALMVDLGVADRVVARAGAFPDVYFDAEGQAAVDAAESLGEDLDESGHLQISQEAILATDPDLVVGVPDGIDRDGLEDQGITVLDQPANCPEGIEEVSYDAIYDYVDAYGSLFGVEDRAREVVGELQDRIAAAEAMASEAGEERTAAILYPTVGGGTTYAYGTLSMSHRQIESAGFTNVFGDTDERVFEVTAEELIARDPDVLLLLHVDGGPGPVEDAVVQLPGADGITAVRDGAVMAQLFSFSEYLSPLIVDGLERIVETLVLGEGG